jgi:3-hydroxyacyl-CoA dehydrogenase
MKRTIKKVAVIGSELWVQLLAIFNIGVEVLLLDIVQRTEAKKGLTLESKAVRNRLVNEHLGNALKSTLSYFSKSLLIVSRQEMTDDMAKLLLLIGLSK